MRISKYGISLIRLVEADLELVRKWRNDDEIRKFMNFRDYITKEMQLKWFESINTSDNFYYVIQYEGEKIGLVNDKNIDWNEKIAEGGLFIWDKRYINSTIPMKISLLMLELAYTLLGWNKTIVKVRKDNPRALKYNESLGYIVVEHNENSDYYTMELEKTRFFENFQKINRLVNPDSLNEPIILTFESIDKTNGTMDIVQKIIDDAPKDSDRSKIEIRYL
ncbi:MAG: GNAT family N-acetyltransferase [Crocinitomicaceae bacterium]|jgi:RimJ/RimL family protein N-acetyltransferase